MRIPNITTIKHYTGQALAATILLTGYTVFSPGNSYQPTPRPASGEPRQEDPQEAEDLAVFRGMDDTRILLRDCGITSPPGPTGVNVADRDSITSLALGDMDGDGDLDVVVGTQSGCVRVIKNKIPQASQ